MLGEILEVLRREGIAGLAPMREELAGYRKHLEAVDPDELSHEGALAYWLDLYNAGALDLAAEAFDDSADTVLRVPGGFTRPWTTVAGEALSLDDIEHGKLRRLGDPRIHGALVCGSASCPTLRYEPYQADRLSRQLDDQLRSFLAAGAARVDRDAGEVSLSRVFLWYGGDFTRPHRMPTWLPPRRRILVRTLTAWLDPKDAAWVYENDPTLRFQSYDWSLACTITPVSDP